MRPYLKAMEIVSQEIVFDNFGTLILVKNKKGEEIVHGVAGFHSEYYQSISSFKNGTPITEKVGKCYATWYNEEGSNRDNFVFELTLDEFVDLSQKDLEVLKSKIKSKDNIGAVYASRHQYLQGVIDFLKENYSGKMHPSEIMPKQPRTGVYVISENFCNDSIENHFNPEDVPLEGFKIISDNKYHPVSAALILTQIFGPKFGDVVPHTCNLFDNKGGIMNLGYFAHEVPEYAVPWVKNPVTITLK